MNTSIPPQRFNRVMVASAGATGLPVLARFARQLSAANAAFRLVDIVCNPAALFPTLLLDYPDWCEVHRAMLHGAQASLRETQSALDGSVDAPETEVIDLVALRQDAVEALAHAALHWEADLIAVAAHAVEHRRAGRIDPEELVGWTRRPVLYMPPASLRAGDATMRRVLVAIDGSDMALEALRTALDVAPPDACIKVVYAADGGLALREWLPFEVLSEHRLKVLRHGEAMLEHSNRVAETALLDFDDDSGDEATAILAEAQRWQADLLVMGSHGLRGASHPLPGHVTSRTLRDAVCPVLVCSHGESHVSRVSQFHGGSVQASAASESSATKGDDDAAPFYRQ
jgi:nucleotide-binding universal stress UspA family protein